MREIKFRIWDITEKEMIYPDLYWFEEEGVREVPGDAHGYQVMQFTGLTDCQEKEIYESDVVRWDYKGMDYIRIVTWGADQAMFLPNDMKNDVEVIGNIYDNPELLQKADNP